MPINKGRPVFIVFHVQLTETNRAIIYTGNVFLNGYYAGVSHASEMDSRPLVASLIRRPGESSFRFVSFRGKSHNGRNRLSADRGLSTRFQLHEERGGYIINESRHRFDHQFPEEKEVGERGVSFFIKIIYHRV